MKLRTDIVSEFVQHQTKFKIKNPWRLKIMKCLKCGKDYREQASPDIIHNKDGTRIELELIQVCPKDFRKILNVEKKRQWLLEMMSKNWLTTKIFEKYKKNEISELEINKLVNKKRNDEIKKLKIIKMKELRKGKVRDGVKTD